MTTEHRRRLGHAILDLDEAREVCISELDYEGAEIMLRAIISIQVALTV